MKIGFLDFCRDIANFLRGGSVLGIDIGTASIKVVELSGRGGKLRLLNYGILETKKYLEQSNQVIQTGSLEIVEERAVELLRILLNEVKPKSKVTLAAIPAFSVFFAPLEMPLLNPEETAKSVAFQARQYIPLPPDKVSLDWIKVDEFEDERGAKLERVLLIGIPVSVIKKYKTIFKNLGLRLTLLEAESLALVRAVGKLSKPTLLVDLGAEATNIVVTEDGAVKHAAVSDYGGVHISRALSKSLGLSMRRAEELKRHRGLLGKEGETELSTLVLPFLDVIIQEVRYGRDSYERRYGKRVEALMLLGGGANLQGIEKHFSSELDLPVVKPSIFEAIEYDSALEPVIGNLTRELAVAVGLAKRYFL